MFFIKDPLLNHSGSIWFEISYSIYQFNCGEMSQEMCLRKALLLTQFWVTRIDRDSVNQTTWISQILPQRYVCVGCQLNSDQAFRLLCLKGHVRALDSTLWRYRWQEASDFLCTKIPLLEGVEQRKNRGKIKKCSLQRAPDWCCCYSSWFHLGWHFWMLFRSSKFQALTSHWPRFSEQRRLSFELWALKELSRMSPQVGLAVLC